jgi:hypothetical protein
MAKKMQTCKLMNLIITLERKFGDFLIWEVKFQKMGKIVEKMREILFGIVECRWRLKLCYITSLFRYTVQELERTHKRDICALLSAEMTSLRSVKERTRRGGRGIQNKDIRQENVLGNELGMYYAWATRFLWEQKEWRGQGPGAGTKRGKNIQNRVVEV